MEGPGRDQENTTEARDAHSTRLSSLSGLKIGLTPNPSCISQEGHHCRDHSAGTPPQA